jgi:hypothetical protein
MLLVPPVALVIDSLSAPHNDIDRSMHCRLAELFGFVATANPLMYNKILTVQVLLK